jgi:hypothetical protein
MKKRTIAYGLGINFLVAGSVVTDVYLVVLGCALLISVKLYEYLRGETVRTLVVGFCANMAITLLPTALTAEDWKVAVYLAATIASAYVAGFVYFIGKHAQK